MTHFATGRFVLSVDLGSNLMRAEQFLKRLQKYRIRATWGVNNVTHDVVQNLLRLGHDIALLPTQRQTRDRQCLAAWLNEQVEAAKDLDGTVSTIALPSDDTSQLDLLVRHPFRTVRLPENSQGDSGAVRYGMWLTRPNLVLGDGASWMSGRWTIRRAVRKTCLQRGLLHAWLHVDDMGNTPVGRSFNLLLDGVEKQLESNLLVSQTLAEVTETVLPRRREAARSILRAA